MSDTVKKFVLTVFTNPVAGREEEYNKWYNEVHVPDVLRIPGFTAARRFKLGAEAESPHKYLAIYEFEATDPAIVLSALQARAGTPDMVLSEGLDMSSLSMIPWAAI
jgi:hypothetical protein